MAKTWKKKEKKEKDYKKICQDCVKSYDENEMYFYYVESFMPHWALCCTKCEKKYDITKIYSLRKLKKVIDTKGWVLGEPTKKGNSRYIFIDLMGKEVTLLPDTGIKKGLKPKIQL